MRQLMPVLVSGYAIRYKMLAWVGCEVSSTTAWGGSADASGEEHESGCGSDESVREFEHHLGWIEKMRFELVKCLTVKLLGAGMNSDRCTRSFIRLSFSFRRFNAPNCTKSFHPSGSTSDLALALASTYGIDIAPCLTQRRKHPMTTELCDGASTGMELKRFEGTFS
jgi:hypothetical protein